MKIDIATLFTVFVMNCVAVGAIFVGAWFRSRSPVSLRVGVAALLIAGGVSLLLLRGQVPEWMSIGFGNTLILVGLGLAWSGVRAFEEQPAPAWMILAGGALWLVF